jgi:dolichol kinase/phosphoserine phosphatase
LGLQEKKKRGLVVFDVEGVLIPKRRYLFFGVGRTLGFPRFMRIVFFGFLYELGLISLKSALKHVFKVFKGIRVEELLRTFEQVPIMPNVEAVFERLRKEGWQTALISSGLPTIVVQDLASTIKADHAYGFELELQNEALTGNIHGEVIEQKGKLPILEGIVKTEEFDLKDCVVVADDRNNASIFLPEMLKIGYNPDFAIRVIADTVITGRLEEVLPTIIGENAPKRKKAQLFRGDVVREAMHASGFFVPILAGFAGLYLVAMVILIVTFLYVVSELGRMERKNLPIIASLTRLAATQPELYEFATAPIFYALGILLTLLFFPSPISSAAIAIFALGDSAASIFGKVFGKTTLPFNRGKTLEGSAIGFLFAFLAGAFFIAWPKAAVGAFIAMVIESLPLPLNDNLLTPLITGVLLNLTV